MVFIALSVILAVFMAAWAIAQYQTLSDVGYLATAVGCMGSAAALAVYGTKFQRKTKRLV